MKRKAKELIHVGGVPVGGDSPITVQSMTKTDTRDVAATVAEIHALEEAGCEIIRCAVPDAEAAKALLPIKRQISLPLIADIHFSHKLALASIDSGVDGLRLNPGNLRNEAQVKEVVQAAKAARIPIRIGVNFGSLPPVGGIGKTGGFNRSQDKVDLLAKAGDAVSGEYGVVDHMVDTALWEVGLLEREDFFEIKLSMKAFDVPTTVEAYRRIHDLLPYPLHLGITESGTVRDGSIRSAAGLAVLLYEGIGDTIRVSLQGETTEEVRVGYSILKALNLRQRGLTLIACPSCGRADVPREVMDQVIHAFEDSPQEIKLAVMQCEVNGPGEAKDADLGVAFGAGKAVIFAKGEKVTVVDNDQVVGTLRELAEKL